LIDEEYRDVVAEMIDQVIAQLSRRQKWAIMAIWLYRQSETATADEWNMSRERFKGILCTAITWFCGGLASRIDAEPSVENVDRWERRQQGA